MRRVGYEMHPIFHAQLLLPPDLLEVPVWLDAVEQVLGGHAEDGAQLCAGISAGLQLEGLLLVVHRDQPLLGAQVLRAALAEIDRCAFVQHQIGLVTAIQNQHLLSRDVAEIPQFGLGDGGGAPFVSTLVDREGEGSVAEEGEELVLLRSVEFDILVQADDDRARVEHLDQDVLVGGIEPSVAEDLASVLDPIRSLEALPLTV
jgi:hypothetical protein